MTVKIIKLTKSEFKPGMIVCPIDEKTMVDAIKAYLSGKVDYSWLLYRSPVDHHIYCLCDGEDNFGIDRGSVTGFENDLWFGEGIHAVIMKEDVSEENAEKECVKLKKEYWK